MESISTDELTKEEVEHVKERAVAVTEKIAVVKKQITETNRFLWRTK